MPSEADLDEPISLHPLDPAEVLKDLLGATEDEDESLEDEDS